MKTLNGKIIFLLIFAFLLWPHNIFGAADLAQRLAGYILLQVEDNGEAWYVNPINYMRYYLGKPEDAYSLMREQGLGITNVNLKKIPIGLITRSGNDTDGDGLNDTLEIAIGTSINNKDTDSDGFGDREEILGGFNPLGLGTERIDVSFTNKYLGRIFLQTEMHGEAWYVNPRDRKRYFLGTKDDAFVVMRELGLGIKNKDLSTIIALEPGYDLRRIEFLTFELVNQERLKYGLEALRFNEDLSRVAREHSLDLAQENEAITGMEYNCDYPIIHHEGLEFGLYNSDRLHYYDIYYFNRSGENIASISGPEIMIRFDSREDFDAENQECQDTRVDLEDEFREKVEIAGAESEKKQIINTELAMRSKLFDKGHKIDIMSIVWDSPETIAQNTVEGWMNSPGHRANILEPEYDEAGMGVAYINGYFILTQNFISRADCGYKGGSCCRKTGYYPYCFVGYECEDSVCK